MRKERVRVKDGGKTFGAAIVGVGMSVPERRLTNEDLSKMVETNDEWIVTRTGIKERRIVADDEGTSHLASRAAAEAVEHAGLDPGDIDLIIVATSTPDLNFPPVACLVQAAIGADNAAAYDLNGVCAGFLNAYVTASQFVRSGTYRHVLVIGAETLSRIVDYTDRNTCILFGDGAGAVVVGRTEPGTGLLESVLHSDGTLAGLAYAPKADSPKATLEAMGARSEPYIWQDGRAVFKVAVKGMADAVSELLERRNLGTDDLRVLVPHQANQRIMDSLAQRLNFPAEKVANCIAEYGNTSAATIPLALYKWFHTEGLEPGDKVMLCAFAGGLLWGAALLEWAEPIGD